MTTSRAFNIAVLNRTGDDTIMSDARALQITQALQKAVNGPFYRWWRIDANIRFIERANTKDWKGAWNVVLLDTSDEAGALGYHDLTPEGKPLSKCFIKTDLQYGSEPSVTVSHELWEMLVDPYISLFDFDSNRRVFVAHESADAVEADDLAFEVDGVKVSDFVLPRFFDPTARNSGIQFSYQHAVNQPFELAHGGYEILYIPGKGFTQNVAKEKPEQIDVPKVGSRRERRIRGHSNWTRSID
jgi:hypothetical protein